MNFKENVIFYLNEVYKKDTDYKLAPGVKKSDALLGYDKAKTKSGWRKLTQTEFEELLKTHMRDNRSASKKIKGQDTLASNFTKEDYKMAFIKLKAIMFDEAKLKMKMTVDYSDMLSDIDKNPGDPANMLISIFLNFVYPAAKEGRLTKTQRDILSANSAPGTPEYNKYYKE